MKRISFVNNKLVEEDIFGDEAQKAVMELYDPAIYGKGVAEMMAEKWPKEWVGKVSSVRPNGIYTMRSFISRRELQQEWHDSVFNKPVQNAMVQAEAAATMMSRQMGTAWPALEAYAKMDAEVVAKMMQAHPFPDIVSLGVRIHAQIAEMFVCEPLPNYLDEIASHEVSEGLVFTGTRREIIEKFGFEVRPGERSFIPEDHPALKPPPKALSTFTVDVDMANAPQAYKRANQMIEILWDIEKDIGDVADRLAEIGLVMERNENGGTYSINIVDDLQKPEYAVTAYFDVVNEDGPEWAELYAHIRRVPQYRV